eukprot:6145457-Lingulodinium_polyedra.AAC.1
MKDLLGNATNAYVMASILAFALSHLEAINPPAVIDTVDAPDPDEELRSLRVAKRQRVARSGPGASHGF